MDAPDWWLEEETADFDPCVVPAVAVDACELLEGDQMSVTGASEDGSEEDDAESPPCKRARI